jgi:hypothetical protein
MIHAIVGVMTLGVIAAIVYQFVRAGSRGPQVTARFSNDVIQYFAILTGK